MIYVLKTGLWPEYGLRYVYFIIFFFSFLPLFLVEIAKYHEDDDIYINKCHEYNQLPDKLVSGVYDYSHDSNIKK